MPEGTDPYDESVYAKAAENFKHLIAEGVLQRDATACYYAYQIIMDEHTQTGLVASASVIDYDSNKIRKHEFTRPLKEDDRVRQIEAVNAQTGPVLLVYPKAPKVDEILAEVTVRAHDADVTADDGVRHIIWVINDEAVITELTKQFDAMQAIYIADGHHRSASGSRVCATRLQENLNHSGNESYNHFLSVIFPHHEMKIFDYNRVITDLFGLTHDEFLSKVKATFTVTESAIPYRPNGAAEFGMYINGQWYKLVLSAEKIPRDDPVARLDVSLLADFLIDPILGIADPRRDTRIDFVGGIRGLEGLEKRVNSGEMAVAFSLFATSMEDLMSVANANKVMPPKSTWFEPKLADGLVSHVLD